MNPHSTPGPDGFTWLFYCPCWSIIYGDIVMAVVMFFEQDRIAQGFNFNIMAFIPKKPGADRIFNFWPITMANYALKIVIKILSNRLGGIASRILSPEQTRFVRGRHISTLLSTWCLNVTTCWIVRL